MASKPWRCLATLKRSVTRRWKMTKSAGFRIYLDRYWQHTIYSYLFHYIFLYQHCIESSCWSAVVTAQVAHVKISESIWDQVVDRDKGKGEDQQLGSEHPQVLRVDLMIWYSYYPWHHDTWDRSPAFDLQDGTWGTDTMTFQDDELSYALGKQGGTRLGTLENLRSNCWSCWSCWNCWT